MSNVTRNPLQSFADHVFNPTNVWDPEMFIHSRTINGNLEGSDVDSSLRMQYCHGNSYAEGYLNSSGIRIFGSFLQGYQVWIFPLGENFKEVRQKNIPLSFHPTDKIGFIKTIMNHV